MRDAFGHSAAENLLKPLSDRLMEIFGDTDTVGMVAQANGSALSRTDINEFVILCNDVADIESVTWILERIQNSVARPLGFGEEELLFSGSVGISICPHDTDNVDGLLEASALARGHARKLGGRLNVEFYSKQ